MHRSSRIRRPGLLIALAMVAALCIAGCSGCSYYGQSIRGGLEVLLKRQPIEKRLADPATPPSIRRGLETAQLARRFASNELALPDNDSYRTYSDLGRPFALWNVVATPELAVRPIEWCFPIAGCVSYRGYFSEQRAERFAAKLRRRGFDTQVGPVTAYSTLGWFDDPVLNTFVELPAPRLAGLIFHELAHQLLYVPGDTAFNESFATVVEIEGVRRWLERFGTPEEEAAYRRSKARGNRFVDLVLAHRDELEEIYATDHGEAWKRWHKRRVLGELRHEFRRLRQSDSSWEGYAHWFQGGVNNADLAALGAYHRLEPGLERLLEGCAGELGCFYAAAEQLGKAGEEERESVLAEPLSATHFGTAF